MWDAELQVVKPAFVPDRYNPGRGSKTLDPEQGATVLPEIHDVECQPIALVEDTAGGTREHVRTSWRIITERGHNIEDLEHTDGVLVDGIDGVLELEGEVGRVRHPRLGHDEFTVTRWKG